MLVLSRRVGEQIVIENGKVVIDILENQSGSVRLGFSAARDIPIDRAEIHRLKSNKEMRHVTK